MPLNKTIMTANPKHTFKHILLILLSFFYTVSLLAEELNIPDIGESAATTLTLTDEKLMGEAVVRNIRRAGKLIEDPLLNQYINDIGNKLVSVSGNQYYHFKFFIVDDKTINAFALPGGFIGVHYGLFLASRNESELASVLAHEIAHVTQRHHARAYDLGQNYETPVLAALIAAIILGANGNELGQAALASIAGGTAQIAVNFTRRNEKEADRLGIKMLNQAGYDAHSMTTFFEQMYKESRLYGSQGPEFLRSHPVSENRMAEAKLRANQMPLHQPPSSEMYYLMKERIEINSEMDEKQLLKKYASQIKHKTYTNKNAAQYGYAIALLKNNQLIKAKKIILQLRAQSPSRIAYIITEAQIAAKSGEYNDSNRIYKNALDDFPNNQPLTLNYAEALIQQKQYRQAKDILTKHLRTAESLPILYKLLSQVEAKLGNQAATHEIMSQYYYSIGQTHQALSQINIALKTPNLDFYAESRLSAQKEKLQTEIKILNRKELK